MSRRVGRGGLALLSLLGGLAMGESQSAPGGALAPWAGNTHPTDVAKRHVEEITSGRRQYIVVQGGTMDGENCRSPMGVWQPYEQTWESNRSVRMENVGTTDVVNPWLSNGRNQLRTIDEIVATATAPGMTDREKAIALWWFETNHRFHFTAGDNEVKTPVKVHNIYGYNTCGDDSNCLAGLWRRASLKVRPARLVGHCVSQVFYDGGWHLMDGDMQSIYLLRDNETVAAEPNLVRDHDLIKRTHTQGVLQPDGRSGDEWEASLYVYEGDAGGDRDCIGSHVMDMVLRPNEALTWRWGHVQPVKYHGLSELRYPDVVCNGLWEYRPDFRGNVWRKGAESVERVRTVGDGLAAEPGQVGVIVWKMNSPYVIVGGRLEVTGTGAALALSWDGRSWVDVGQDLDPLFPPAGPARYHYYLRCRLPGAARLRGLRVVNDLQMAPLSLPAMTVGRNTFVYTDQTAGTRKVRITHEWVERSASRPPRAPSAPVYPPDGGEANGTDIAFQWAPPAGRIADYHFQLSDRPDMRWPLSMSFWKLVSRTADRGNPRYTLPQPGLLAPDRRYFWRVRARNSDGVWGPWSATWSFTPRGPAPPTDVTLQFDTERQTGTLRWKPNPSGRRPAAYRVYGSDEKGFSVSDGPYAVNVGVTKELPAQFPGNFVVETRATQLVVIGPEVHLPNANRAYYRVVAVDDQGKRSGPSEYAAAPRPVIYTRPAGVARVGQEYRYQVGATRSIGDLRMRFVEGKETAGFWDIERLRFGLQGAPGWLTIDETTGLLSGVPNAAGRVEVTVTVTLERELRKLDEQQLSWGLEKVVARGTEQVGTASQRVAIDVLGAEEGARQEVSRRPRGSP